MAENNNTQIFTIKVDYKELEKYNEIVEKVIGTYDKNISELARVNEQIKANNAAIASLNKEDANYKKTLDALTKEHIKLTTEKSKLLQVIKNEEKIMQSAKGTYENANATLNKYTIAYKRMTEEQQKATAELPKRLNELREQLKQADAAIGNYQRNVGNYGSAWNGLQLQVQQVARELPSLTMGANQFFLAISNNLPMLVDEIKRASQANAEMRAQGEATVPVWKQMISSMFSWQTALVVGITLLSAYGKDIAAWAKELINGKEAVDYLAKSLSGLTGSIMQERLQLDAMFSALRNAKKGTTEYEIARRNIIDKYGSYLKNQRDEIQNLTDLDGAYKALSNTMTAKAIKEGMMQQMTEASKEASEKISEYSEDIRYIMHDILTNIYALGNSPIYQFAGKYTEEQINEIYNNYINAIATNNTKLQKEIEGIFEVTKRNGDKYNALFAHPSAFFSSPFNKLKKSVAEFQTQADAIAKSGKIIANAFNVDFTALDQLADGQDKYAEIQEKINNLIDLWAVKGDKEATELEKLRQQWQDLRKEAVAAGVDVSTFDKAYLKMIADLKQAKLDEAMGDITNFITEQANAGDTLASQLAKLQKEYNELRKSAIAAGVADEELKKLEAAYQQGIVKIYQKHYEADGKAKLLIKVIPEFELERPDASELLDLVSEVTSQIKDATTVEPQFNPFQMTDDQKEQIISSAVSTAGQIFSTIEQMQQESIQRRMQDELDALNRETDSKKQALKTQQENGIISQKAYERKLAQIDKEAAARQEEIKKAAFEKQKKWNIMQALMNGALAITNIWSQHAANPIMAAILTALSVATTTAQVATISAQKYARGGLLRGRSHAQGGIRGQIDGNPIEVEGDEVIINKRSARVFRNELSAINSYNGWGNPLPNAGRPRFMRDMKFARGGVLAGYNFDPAPLPMSAASVSTARTVQQDKQILRYMSMLIDGRIAQIRATVLYHDIEEIEDELRINVSRASM